MLKTKERSYYETLHSQDNLSVTCWNDNNVVVRHHIFLSLTLLKSSKFLKVMVINEFIVIKQTNFDQITRQTKRI